MTFIIGITDENSDKENAKKEGIGKSGVYWKAQEGKHGETKYKKENDSYSTTDDIWIDDCGNVASVMKYGGFYIGRYEAGLPKDDSLWKNEDGAKYGYTHTSKENGSKGTDRFEDEDGLDLTNPRSKIANMVPVSKKNNAVWNFVTVSVAKQASKNMYKSNLAVTSQLIDSYAWDTAVEWIRNSGIDVTNSDKYGNYWGCQITGSGLYAISSTSMRGPTEYKFGDYGVLPKDVDHLREIGTGTSEDTRVNNVYDLAGNVWEYTTEYSKTSINLVARGGCYWNDNGSKPIFARLGTTAVESQYRI